MARRSSRRDRVWRILLLVSFVAVVLLAAGALIRQSSAGALAARQAQQYNAEHPAGSQKGATPSESKVVTVVGDDLSAVSATGTVAIWPVLAGRELGDDVVSLSVAGSGYVKQPTVNSFGGTFPVRAGQVAPDSKVVVIFGGGNDVGTSAKKLIAAAETTYSTAQSIAPAATIVVVGPTWTTVDPPESIRQVRSSLEKAAKAAGVRFIDPIEQGWLVGVRNAVVARGSGLQPAGEAAVTRRMVDVLQPLLR